MEQEVLATAALAIPAHAERTVTYPSAFKWGVSRT